MMSFNRFLLVLVTLLTLCFVNLFNSYADQSLYSYVMSVYDKEYTDMDSVEDRLSELQEEYDLAAYSNLRFDSYEAVKSYAVEVEEDVNSKIDSEIEYLKKKQDKVASEIENGLVDLSPSELSKLGSEYNNIQEEVNKLLNDKTFMVEMLDVPIYDSIDLSEIEQDIEYQKELVSSSGYVSDSLGSLSELKRPFNFSVRVTSPAGFREDPITGDIKYHNATDYGMPVGTELYSLFNGVVVRSDNVGDAYGESIKIDCGNGIVLHYAHMSERYVEVGDVVSQNQIIGLSGNTGRSTGPHLHLSLFYNGEVLSVEELFNDN